MTFETLQTFDQSDVRQKEEKTKNQTEEQKNRRQDKIQKPKRELAETYHTSPERGQRLGSSGDDKDDDKDTHKDKYENKDRTFKKKVFLYK